MAWIDPAYKTESCDNETSYVANSNERGNYSNDIKVTGSDDKYRVKIYMTWQEIQVNGLWKPITMILEHIEEEILLMYLLI